LRLEQIIGFTAIPYGGKVDENGSNPLQILQGNVKHDLDFFP
jgi:hypothetical protein